MRNLANKCTKERKMCVTSTEDDTRNISKANLCIINRHKDIGLEGQIEDGLMFEDGTD
jgi:hypothetical protein